MLIQNYTADGFLFILVVFIFNFTEPVWVILSQVIFSLAAS